ncbi:MAG TPA: rhomboid family intramembrane serine protease [Solirubrobacteraceae bacterium]
MFPLKDNIPTDRFPVVTVAIIVANVIVYFFLQKHVGTGLSGINSVDDGNVVKWAAIPYELTHPGKECGLDQAGQVLCEGQRGVSGTPPDQPPAILTVFSAMFMHGGLLHIGGNMLYLRIFGNNVEDSMGRARFVVFYLLGGLAALALQIAVDPSSQVPTLGASGAIAGVLGGYVLLYPRARVLTVIFIIFFFTLIEIPALFVLGFWFVLQVLSGAYDLSDPTGGGGGVAYFAHIGGFVFGLAAIKVFAQRIKQAPTARFPVY